MTESPGCMYQPTVILGEGVWQIDIPLPPQKSESEAVRIANGGCAKFHLTLINDKPAIQTMLDGRALLFFDTEVFITEISKEKQATMGPPLDMTNPENIQVAVEALKTMDPAYVIEPKDMVPSLKTLSWFIGRYGVGYSLDCIAYGVEPYKDIGA